MDFFIIDKELQEKFDQLSRRIRRLQNGGCIDSLRHLGVDTEKQVGASFLSLKTLAANYLPDEKLAVLLWNTRKREEQIMACLLLPKETNKEKITQLLQECHKFEIAEYFGSQYLASYPGILPVITEWIADKNPYLQVAALIATARHRILNKTESLVTPEFYKEIISRNYEDKYVRLIAHRFNL